MKVGTKLQHDVGVIRNGPHTGKWKFAIGTVDEIVSGFGCFFIEFDSRQGKRNDNPDPVGLYPSRSEALAAARKKIHELGGK